MVGYLLLLLYKGRAEEGILGLMYLCRVFAFFANFPLSGFYSQKMFFLLQCKPRSLTSRRKR